jgi:hypothetical protein
MQINHIILIVGLVFFAVYLLNEPPQQAIASSDRTMPVPAWAWHFMGKP